MKVIVLYLKNVDNNPRLFEKSLQNDNNIKQNFNKEKKGI